MAAQDDGRDTTATMRRHYDQVTPLILSSLYDALVGVFMLETYSVALDTSRPRRGCRHLQIFLGSFGNVLGIRGWRVCQHSGLERHDMKGARHDHRRDSCSLLFSKRDAPVDRFYSKLRSVRWK